MKERTIDKIIRSAKERGLTGVQVAKQLGVDKQVFTNWKKRGLPPAMNQRAADFIGCSIDELVGRLAPPSKVVESRALYGYGLTAEGARVGAEWQKLDEPLRSQIQVLIETLVARRVRDSRSKRLPADQKHAST